MTPQIVQLLGALADREPAFRKTHNRASGFLYSRIHAGTLPRSEVDGPNRIVLKGLDSKSSESLKEDIHAHLHSYRMKVYDPDMHASILIRLMDEALAGDASTDKHS